MAKQLYDYWFVQFDFPDENGRPYKSNGGKMVYNEKLKREIPLGWNYCTLGDFCEMYQPKTLGLNDLLADGKYKVYGANGIIGYYSSYNHENSEIAMACRGNSCGAINRTYPKSWITGNAMVIKIRDSHVHNEYIKQTLKYANVKGAISGSGQPQLTRENLSSIRLILPNSIILESFSKKIEFLVSMELEIERQNDELTKQRDELLPLLMNGQISLNYHLSEWIIGFLCHDMHIEYDKSIIEKDANEQNSYPSVRKPYSLTLFKHTGNPFFMFLLLFKLIVPVSHELPADLHDKICANFIQGFQGIGMHTCADVLFLQIRYGIGEICYDVRHAVLDGTDFFQQVAQLCYPAVCFLFGRIIGKPLTQGGCIGLFHIRCCLLGLSFAFHS